MNKLNLVLCRTVPSSHSTCSITLFGRRFFCSLAEPMRLGKWYSRALLKVFPSQMVDPAHQFCCPYAAAWSYVRCMGRTDTRRLQRHAFKDVISECHGCRSFGSQQQVWFWLPAMHVQIHTNPIGLGCRGCAVPVHNTGRLNCQPRSRICCIFRCVVPYASRPSNKLRRHPENACEVVSEEHFLKVIVSKHLGTFDVGLIYPGWID